MTVQGISSMAPAQIKRQPDHGANVFAAEKSLYYRAIWYGAMKIELRSPFSAAVF